MAVHRTLLLSPILGLGCKLGRHCVPVMEIACPARTSEDIDPQNESSLYTWKALNSIFITIFKHSEDSTVIYVHPSDMHYNAAPLGCLGASCPVGTTLLAQVVLDYTRQKGVEQQWTPSVLIFDAIQIGRDDFVQMHLAPVERYRRLLELCGSNYPNSVISSPIMSVQWAGQYSALKKFCIGPESEKNLQHITENVFQFTRDHPCKIISVQ
jgi:hypothetical protein